MCAVVLSSPPLVGGARPREHHRLPGLVAAGPVEHEPLGVVHEAAHVVGEARGSVKAQGAGASQLVAAAETVDAPVFAGAAGPASRTMMCQHFPGVGHLPR